MIKELDFLTERKIWSERDLICGYLGYESVGVLLGKFRDQIPYEHADIHRILNRYGIVKSAGPNREFSELLYFLGSVVAKTGFSLPEIYRTLPKKFKTSLETLTRVVREIKEGVTTRAGCALVISTDNNSDFILVGKDTGTERLNLGKPFGSASLPMGYAKRSEQASDSILRILQREVFTKQTICGTFPTWVVPDRPDPFMKIAIGNVLVSVFRLVLPKELCQEGGFSSFKLIDHGFVEAKDLINDRLLRQKCRAGVFEIAREYRDKLNQGSVADTSSVLITSFLNQEIALRLCSA